MTITFLDDNGTLQNRYQQRQFTATSSLAYACVDYFDPTRPNEKRPQEVVFRDGSFQFPYDVGSKKEGSLYTVVRQGGWADSLHLRAEESGAPSAALQPLDGDVVAAWALLADRSSVPMVTPGTDRSGNGRDLSTPNSYYSIPDLIPGQSAQQMINGFGGMTGNPAHTALQILGELTITLRVWCPGIGLTAPGYLWSQSNYHDASEAGNCIGSLVVADTDAHVSYFAMNGPGRTAVVATHSAPMTRAAWNYISLRRNAAGTAVTLGMNNANETTTGLLPPTGGGTSFPAIGTSSFGSEYPTCGMADVVVRNVSRNDADLTSWFKIAMGL